MAEQAQKEPTMEEILASIRKIISEDDGDPPRKAESAEAPRLTPDDLAEASEAEAPAEEAFSLDSLARETGEDEDVFDEVELGAQDPATGAEETEDGAFDALDELVDESFAEEALETEPAEDFADPEPRESLTEPEPELEPISPVAPAPIPESAMMSEEKLTDETTADAAAGALARLVSKMDVASDTTLEGLVRELLKPMIKEWLDDNLAAIVEEKVEAEVQRISRLAR